MTEEWNKRTNAIDVTYFITDKLFEVLHLVREVSDLLSDNDLLEVCGSEMENLIDTVEIEDNIMKGMGRLVLSREEASKNFTKE